MALLGLAAIRRGSPALNTRTLTVSGAPKTGNPTSRRENSHIHDGLIFHNMEFYDFHEI